MPKRKFYASVLELAGSIYVHADRCKQANTDCVRNVGGASTFDAITNLARLEALLSSTVSTNVVALKGRSKHVEMRQILSRQSKTDVRYP